MPTQERLDRVLWSSDEAAAEEVPLVEACQASMACSVVRAVSGLAMMESIHFSKEKSSEERTSRASEEEETVGAAATKGRARAKEARERMC